MLLLIIKVGHFDFGINIEDNENYDDFIEEEVHKVHRSLFYWIVEMYAKADGVDIANNIDDKEGHYVDRFAEILASNNIYVGAFGRMLDYNLMPVLL